MSKITACIIAFFLLFLLHFALLLYFIFSDGPHLRKITQSAEFEGLTGNDTEFKAARSKFIDQIEMAVDKRFSDFSSPNVVLATRIADLQSWPKTWESLKGSDKQCYSVRCFLLYSVVICFKVLKLLFKL